MLVLVPLAAGAYAGVAPGYRLERLSGRYVSLEQERTATRTLVDLAEGEWPDIWQLDQTFNLLFVGGIYGSATYMPLATALFMTSGFPGQGLWRFPQMIGPVQRSITGAND